MVTTVLIRIIGLGLFALAFDAGAELNRSRRYRRYLRRISPGTRSGER